MCEYMTGCTDDNPKLPNAECLSRFNFRIQDVGRALAITACSIQVSVGKLNVSAFPVHRLFARANCGGALDFFKALTHVKQLVSEQRPAVSGVGAKTPR